MSTPRFDKEMSDLFSTSAPTATAVAGLMADAETEGQDTGSFEEAVGGTGEGAHEGGEREEEGEGASEAESRAEAAAQPEDAAAEAGTEAELEGDGEAEQEDADADATLVGTFVFGAFGLVARSLGLGK